MISRVWPSVARLGHSILSRPYSSSHVVGFARVDFIPPNTRPADVAQKGASKSFEQAESKSEEKEDRKVLKPEVVRVPLKRGPNKAPPTVEGKINFGDGKKYVGGVANGKMHGTGTLTYKNEKILQGNFRDGKIYFGKGYLELESGDTYQGHWKHGALKGNARHTSPLGHIYVGDFVKNTRHGIGVLTYPSGTKYRGFFKDGEKHGRGREISVDGHILDGEFKAGRIFNGVGSVMSAKGVLSEGEWKEGVLYGKITGADGVVKEGIFKAGNKYVPKVQTPTVVADTAPAEV